MLAETSLEGSRIVALLRVLLLLARGGAMALLGPASTLDPRRGVIVLAYGLLAIGYAIGISRVRAGHPGRARSIYYFTASVDALFLLSMAKLDAVAGDEIDLAMSVAGYAVVIAFSLASFNVKQVLFTVCIATACYAQIAVWRGAFDLASFLFVALSFGFFGVLMTWANRRVARLAVDLRRRDGLSRMLPAAVVDRLMSLEDQALAPVQREATVLFLDIRGFTTLSEKLAPDQVLALLDELLGRVSHRIQARGGLVNKFLGDGLLAFWNVPNVQENHAALAVHAALEIRTELEAFNRTRSEQQLPLVHVGIGIHTGVVAAGTLGGKDQYEYTVIGDPVNLASRIEGLTRQFGVDVLISGATWRCVEGAFEARPVGIEKVRGRVEPVELFALERTASRVA